MAEQKPLVLVVDDDADIRDAICDTLQQEGYLTAEAINGIEALQYLTTQPCPALVLLDWNMAPMSGADFMSALASAMPLAARPPVVLLTADGRVSADDVKARDFVAHLKKPVRLELLFAVVEKYIRVHKADT